MKKPSRREFLRGVLIAGSALTLSKLQLLRAQSERILIIGAGAAGLAAARTLKDAGYGQITVLEARNRIGGRTFSNYDLAPYPIEMGGEFIEAENVITWDYMERFNLEPFVASEDDENQFVYYDEYLYNSEEWEEEEDIEPVDDVEELVYDWEDDDASVEEVIEEEEEEADAELMRLIDNQFASEYGANIKDLGAYGLMEDADDEEPENNTRMMEGYTALMERLAEGLDIRLDSPVEKIEWGEDGVIVYSGDSTFEADKVIITLPLGVLQAGDVRFDPPLPDDKQAAIDGLGAGHVDKIILKFRSAIYPADVETVMTSLDTRMWWRPGWDRPNEVPILTALVGGETAKRFELMSPDDVIKAALEDLSQMFGLDLGTLKNELETGLFVSWGSDPYSKMGYSYVPVGASELRDVLAESVDDVLFFAGEATHLSRSACVHGALESGQRAALEVMGEDE